LLSFDAPNRLISAFPLVVLGPVFAVPLAILLHLISLMRLRETLVQRISPRSIAARAY
jgi:hypothetical protein